MIRRIVAAVSSEVVLQMFLFSYVESSSKSHVIEDIVTLVKGGMVESSAGLLAIRSPDTYKAWGESLKNNPTVIEFEVTYWNKQSRFYDLT